MKYSVETTKRFEKDLKRCVKRGLPLEAIEDVINHLQESGTLPSHYRPHKLVGSHRGEWECHINLIGYWYGRRMIPNLRC